jgi:hypothetical protein
MMTTTKPTYRRLSRQDVNQCVEARAPKRVVAVVSARKCANYSYVMTTVYDLTARKDGTPIYRRSAEQYAEPRRSQPLTLKDAQEIAAQLDIPLWKQVRHNMKASLAIELDEVFQRKYEVEA